MGRSVPYLLAAALGLLGSLALASCGEEDAQLLPGETAREITANLEAVRQLADEGDCVGAESAAQQVSEQIEALGGVDQRLKQALEDGSDRLSEVVESCEEETVETTETDTVPTEPEEVDKKAEKEQEKEEKELEKEERDREKEEEKERDTPPPTGEPPAEEEEGDDDEEEGEEETSSGGVSPGSSVEGGE
jgi:outer membrane biosynthesis protein TonB